MKKCLFIAIILFLATLSVCFGQNKITKYCKVIIPFYEFKKNVASLYFGKRADLFNFKDSLVIIKLQKVNELVTDTDVLNYMEELGWKLVSINASGGYTNTENLFFKKEFDKSELIDN